MSYKMKYVIVETFMAAVPVVFSELSQHSEIVRGLGYTPDRVLGAGFCILNVEETKFGHEPRFECYGESVSLGGIQSRGEEDSQFLNKYLGLIREY